MRRAIIILFYIIIIFQSCDKRREILDNGMAWVNVELNWENIEKPPNGSSVKFYPRLNEDIEPIFLRTNYAKDRLMLPEDEYDILVLNERTADFSCINFKGTDCCTTFEAHWSRSMLKSEYMYLNEEAVVLHTHDLFLVERMEKFEITSQMIDDKIETTLRFTPRLVNVYVNVIVKIKGIDNMSKSGGLLYMNGMSSGYHLFKNVPSGDPITHVVPLDNMKYDDGSYKDGTMSTIFCCFGQYKDVSTSLKKNIVRLVFKLRDGTTHPDILRDVTSMIVESKDSRGNTILSVTIGTGTDGDTEVVLPKVPDNEDSGSGSGFDADVEDWDDEIVTIIPL